jgi:hypothetical protein
MSVPLLSTCFQALPILLVAATIAIAERRLSMQNSSPFFLASGILLLVILIGPIIYFVVATELLILTNRRDLRQDVEGQWTYGQTLALGAAAISTALVLSELWDLRHDNLKWHRAVSKLRDAIKEPFDWGHIRVVAAQLHSVSLANTVRELHDRHRLDVHELSTHTHQSVMKVDSASADAWNQMSVAAMELETLASIGLCTSREQE